MFERINRSWLKQDTATFTPLNRVNEVNRGNLFNAK